MSARAPAVVTGRAPATFQQFGSSEVGTPADRMTWHQAAQRMWWHADRAAASWGTFGRVGRGLGRTTPVGVHLGPTATRGASRGRGGRPSRNWNAMQNALLLSARAWWMDRAVSQMEDALEAQLNRRALCCYARFQGLPPSWSAVGYRMRLAAVARDVSFWACGSTWRRHTLSTTAPWRSSRPTWSRSVCHSRRRPSPMGPSKGRNCAEATFMAT